MIRNPWPQFDQYFQFISAPTAQIESKGLSFKCKNCDRIIKTPSTASSNLTRHYKLIHKEDIKENSGKCSRLLPINQFIIQYFIESGAPFCHIELPAFQNMFREHANGIIKTTETLQQEIDKIYWQFQENILNTFEGLEYIACTADIWKSYNKAYIGITASWIDIKTYKHCSCLLRLQRLIVSITFEEIGKTLQDTFTIYNISNKIVSVTTDNGSNFLKAFRIYGENEVPLNEINDDVEFETIIIEDNYEVVAENPLPPNIKCAAHGLNLVAKGYLKHEKLSINSDFQRVHKSTFKQCKLLWNKQSQSTKNADIIREILGGVLLKVPNDIRWNAEYDAVICILKYRDKLPLLTKSLNISSFTSEQLNFLNEFVKVMKPISVALDILQGNDCFYGTLYVVIKGSLLHLQRYKDELMKYGSPLAETLIELLQLRFDDVLNSTEAIKAASLYPLTVTALPEIKEYGLSQCSHFESMCENVIISEFQISSQEQQLQFFSVQQNGTAHNCKLYEFFSCPPKDINNLDHFPCIKKLFLRFNTRLPTSAFVERVFSIAKSLLTAYRTRLSDDNFEKILCLKLRFI